jgi:hypothetical protein
MEKIQNQQQNWDERAGNRDEMDTDDLRRWVCNSGACTFLRVRGEEKVVTGKRNYALYQARTSVLAHVLRYNRSGFQPLRTAKIARDFSLRETFNGEGGRDLPYSQ